MKPTFSARKRARSFFESCVISWPSIEIRPSVGASKQPRILSKVLLPEPDGPITATHSPLEIDRDTLLSALTDGPYCFVSSCISIKRATQTPFNATAG